MLWYAIMAGSDIECEEPVSEDLAFKVNNYLLPALMRDKERTIQVICETVREPYANVGKAGSGMSCGLDSLYTLYRYTREDVPEDYKLSLLTYFHHGNIVNPDNHREMHYSVDEFYERAEAISDEKAMNAQKICDEAGLPLLYAKTNLDQNYYRGAFGFTAVYRNSAIVLALQGLFSKYYLSSEGSPNFFELNLTAGSEHYETLLAHVFFGSSCRTI